MTATPTPRPSAASDWRREMPLLRALLAVLCSAALALPRTAAAAACWTANLAQDDDEATMHVESS